MKFLKSRWAWLITVLAIAYLSFTFLPGSIDRTKTVPWPTFAEYVTGKTINSPELIRTDSKTYLQAKYTPTGKTIRSEVIIPFQTDLLEFLNQNGFNQIQQSTTTTPNYYQFISVGFLLILCLFLYKSLGRGSGLLAFGKSKNNIIKPDKAVINFSKVVGIDEAKEEVSEIVAFLKEPEKFRRLKGKLPKGILLSGSSGTGKTMLARAIAAEAGVPFIAKSGSDFVEMFVGVGAARVRDMFKQAKALSPALIFIDEIDAVGKQRSSGGGAGTEEHSQTLNALLVEMDGIEGTEGIIVIGATNRRDVLDPALIRAGRFDREVHVQLPDIAGREGILKIHSADKKLAQDVDLGKIAKTTPGMSGAELSNLVNEATLAAAMNNENAVSQKDFEYARDKVKWGRARTSLVMTEVQKKITAYHEAGHTIASLALEHADPIHKVTILPQGPFLGATMFLPDEDKWTMAKKSALSQLVVVLAGRAAEEIFLHDICSGASGDIKVASKLARQMLGEWGMGLSMLEITSDVSEQTKHIIDQRCEALIQEGLHQAKKILEANKEATVILAELLLEQETIDADKIAKEIKIVKSDYLSLSNTLAEKTNSEGKASP